MHPTAKSAWLPIAFVSYKSLLGDFESRHFSPYPYYYKNVNGEYDYGLLKGDKKSLLKIGGNYLLGDIVKSVDVYVNYRFNPALGIDVSHQEYFEKIRNGTEFLNITTLLFNYYRFRERWITGWWGAGATYVGNEINTAGFAYNFGVEIYPFNPISIHTSFKQSFINSNSINVLKLQAKYHHKKTAFYSGYHDISLGGVKVSGIVFGIEYGF